MAYKIKIENELIEVAEDVYYAYYRLQNREDYLVSRDKRQGLTYYHALDSEEMSGEEILKDGKTNIISGIIDREEREALYDALRQLCEKDRELIVEIFFNEKTEQEIAKALGVSQPAVHKRKVRILKSLKKILES